MTTGRVIVTGGSGFIGTNVVEHYRQAGWEVLNASDEEPRNGQHRSLWKKVSILDKDALNREFKDFNPDLLIHLAARTDLHGKTLEDYSTNIRGMQNVVDVVNGSRSLERAVYASSRLVFAIGHEPKDDYDYSPSTLYGQSKIETEKIVRSQSEECVPWVLIRPTSIWGPWFDVPYKTFFLSIFHGRYIHPLNHTVNKTFGFIGNVVHEIAALAEAPVSAVNKRAFFVADYEPTDVEAWANLISTKMSAKPVKKAPYSALKFLAIVGDSAKRLGWKNPPLTTFRLDNLITNMVYDMKPLKEVVGPLPYGLEESVEQTVEWMKSAGQI